MGRALPILVALSLASAVACRPLPGEPDYPEVTPYSDTGGDGRLGGDTPWDGATPRMSLSIFYEGGFTDLVQIDDDTVHYYIYEGSFSQQSTGDRVEGFAADQLTVSRNSWWGGGVHSDDPVDLTQWTTLHAALRSEDASMEAFQLGMVGSAAEGRATVKDYGFVADGEWHLVNVPLADMTPAVGFDAVTVPLLLISATARSGANLFIDDLYLTQGD
jgi:hypothetical protein